MGKSLENKLRYVIFVGYGDFAAHKAVCTMNDGNGPYGFNYPVVKEECLNHVSKRLGTRLRGLKKKLAEPVEGKSGKIIMKSKLGGIGKLTDKVTDRLAGYCGTTMRKFVKKGGDKSKVAELASEMMALYLHVTSSDKDPRHFWCLAGEDSWCFYKKPLAKKETPPSHNTMKVRIEITCKEDRHDIASIYQDLTRSDLLERCMKGRTQNINESIHSKLWKRSMKVKFHGIKKVQYAFRMAALEHNVGTKLVLFSIRSGE